MHRHMLGKGGGACEKKRSNRGALRIFKGRKEPLPFGGGIFSAVSEMYPCGSEKNCGIMDVMKGRLFRGGKDVR